MGHKSTYPSTVGNPQIPAFLARSTSQGGSFLENRSFWSLAHSLRAFMRDSPCSTRPEMPMLLQSSTISKYARIPGSNRADGRRAPAEGLVVGTRTAEGGRTAAGFSG